MPIICSPPRPVTALSTHWRIVFLGTWDDSVTFAEVAVATSAGGANIIGTATLTYGGAGTWVNTAFATNNNPNDWTNNQTVNGSWLQMVFPVSRTLREVRFTARNSSFSPQAPAAYVVQSSSNGGASWQTVAWYVGAAYTAGETRTFAFNPSAIANIRANARAWRCLVTATVAGGTGGVRCGELYMATSAGGASVTTGGAPVFDTTQPNLDRAFKAFDGITAAGNEHMSQSIAGPWTIGYAFPAAQNLAEIRWAAGGYGAGDLPDNPAAFQIQWTADGVTWTTTNTYTGIAAWPSIGHTRAYAVT